MTTVADIKAIVGTNAVYVSGWEGRGGRGFVPQGVMFHHTAGGKADTASLNICINGRTGKNPLPGPLCNFYISRSGIIYVLASGAANHAGKGAPGVLSAVQRDQNPGGFISTNTPCTVGGNTHFYGVEVEHIGYKTEPWGKQLAAMRALCARICVYHHWSPNRIVGHREWAACRKGDPVYTAELISMDSFRASVAAFSGALPKISSQVSSQLGQLPLTGGPVLSAGFKAGGSKSLSVGEIKSVASQAGWSGTNLDIITAIVLAESRGVPSAEGDINIQTSIWGPSVGLAQIRSVKAEYGRGTTRDASVLKNPLRNLQAALQVYKSAKNRFTPWSTFTTKLPATDQRNYKYWLKYVTTAVATAPAIGDLFELGHPDELLDAEALAQIDSAAYSAVLDGLGLTDGTADGAPSIVRILRHRIKRPMTGPDVRYVQTLLGGLPDQVTGTYDQATEDAVKRFQTSKKLVPSGVFGQRTAEALGLTWSGNEFVA